MRRAVLKTIGVAIAATSLTAVTALGAVAAGDDKELSNAGSGVVAAESTGPDVEVLAAVDTGATEEYTAVTPCRILDTRTTSPIVNTTRNFDVSGTLAGQGGTNSCGIPATATSIAINLTAISTGGSGFIRGWAAGSAPATATLLNFSAALNASNQVNIPLCKGDTCTDAMTLQVFGSSHIVGDAVGYYQAPMHAVIAPDGSAYGGTSGLLSSEKTDTGVYTLTFERSVASCAATTSDLIFAGTRDVSADPTYGAFFGNPNQLVVVVTNPAGANEDTYFNVALHC